MRFAPNTPNVVHDAIRLYVRRRATLAVTTVLALGAGICGLACVAYMVADRLVEWPAEWRQTGPWLVAAVALVTALSITWRLLWSEPARAIAIRLDQKIASNEDRWATSLDLSERQARGESVGYPQAVERLYRETESATAAQAATSVPPVRRRNIALAIALLAAIAFGALHTSDFFNLSLLWQRFWGPFANLPRDSLTRVHIIEVVGSSPVYAQRGMPGYAIPENEAFTIKVKVVPGGPSDPVEAQGRSPSPAPVPFLELGDHEGDIAASEFVRAGKVWTFTRPDVTEAFRFRIRAGDALTQFFDLHVEPRIKIVAFKHSIRFPGYAKLPEVRRQPLEAERLNVLQDSRLEFFVGCDRSIEEIEAVYELLEDQGEADPAATISAKEQWQLGRTHKRKEKEPKEKRRSLRVKIRKGTDATFRLRADYAGVLRVRVTGGNGLAGLERVCVIEPTRDMPPRISITGIEPDTHIVPGELVGFQYQAEDDLAVSDIYLSWGTAGGARTGDLAGEEYLRNSQFGQRIVLGKLTIQRMDYFRYGTEPYVFRLIVTDSKGQESSSNYYRIHLLSDTYATRFEAGMEMYGILQKQARMYRGRLGEMNNHLNILAAAAGQGKTWPENQDKLAENLMKTASGLLYQVARERASHFYSGWPQRMQRSIALLLAVGRCVDSSTVLRKSAKGLLRTSDLPTDLAQMRARIASQAKLARMWEAAVASERERFMPEAVLQRVRNLRQRLRRIDAIRSDRSLYDANLTFYRDELRTLIRVAAELTGPQMERLGPLLGPLGDALAEAEPAELVDRILDIERVLATCAPPLTEPLEDVLAELERRAQSEPEAARRLSIAVAETVASRESDATSAPFDDLKLCRLWAKGTLGAGGPGTWYRLPGDTLDLWVMTGRLLRGWELHRLNTEMRRYELNPDGADDVEAELREQALLLTDLLARTDGLDPGLAEGLRKLLGRAVQGEIVSPEGVKSLEQSPKLFSRLAAAGRARLGGMKDELARMLEELADKQEEVAAAYDAYAAEFEKAQAVYDTNPKKYGDKNKYFGHLRGGAVGLQAGPKAIAVAYRNIHYFRMLLRLVGAEGPLRWEVWQPWHGLQLILLLDGHNSLAKVTFRFNYHARQVVTTVPMHSRAFAQALRSHAQTLRRALEGKPLEFDFQKLMKESRTLGYLKSLEEESALVSAALGGGDQTSRAEFAEAVSLSLFGRIAKQEELLQALLGHRSRLHGAENLPRPELLARLRRVQETLRGEGKDDEGGELSDLLHALERQPKSADGESLTPRLRRKLQAFRGELAEEIDGLFDAVQIPPIDMTGRGNLRWQTASAREFWPIRVTIENYDRRWMYRMRDAQISLVRDLLSALTGKATKAQTDRLAMSYARLVELRARQIAQERRRNRGISFLEEDTGPALKLPPHIAREFIRGRNKRPPAQFEEESEAYFHRIYRDLSN